MKLVNLFSGDRTIENTTGSISLNTGNSSEVSKLIANLVQGQTIRGEILTKAGEEVQIKLTNGMLLSALLDEGINLETGNQVTFEVRNNGKNVTLSPLFTNTAMDDNVIKALDMAGLPVNEKTVEMTHKMMTAGQSVNSSSLHAVFREMHLYADKPIEDIVSLHQLELEVNRDNLDQLKSYQNLEHLISNGMESLVQNLEEDIYQLVKAGESEKAWTLLQQIVNELEYENTEESLPEQEGRTLGEKVSELTGQEDLASGEKVSELSEQEEQTLIEKVSELPEQEAPALGKKVSELSGQEERTLAEKVSEKQGRVPEDKVSALLKTSIDRLKELLQSKWFLKPEEASKPEQVKKVYQIIDNELKIIGKAMEDAGLKESGTMKATSSMSQNIDFMNQVNQLYSYVQIPLKLHNKNGQGELYVYTNKKSLVQKDGNLSALLHLDMDHLGPLDVYVTLNNAKVNTDFKVRDEATLLFLEKHMDLLTQRLKNKGYDCTAKIKIREKQESGQIQSGLQPIIDTKQNVILSQYAFDVRT